MSFYRYRSRPAERLAFYMAGTETTEIAAHLFRTGLPFSWQLNPAGMQDKLIRLRNC